MRKRFVFVAAASMIGAVALHAQQAPPAAAGAFETVVTLPTSGATENITSGPGGDIFITGMDDKVVWKVSKGKDATLTKYAAIPDVAAVVGIAPAQDGVVLTAFGKPFRKPAAAGGAPQIDFSDVAPQVIVIDKAGTIVARVPGAKGQAFNGIARAANGVYLLADSAGPTIWRFDLAKKQLEPWLSDDVLGPPPGQVIGANGIKVRDGQVYVSLSARSAIYRVGIDGGGRPQGSLVKVAEGPRPDDFDVAKDGSIYVPSGTTLYRISRAGEVTKMLDNVPNGAAAMVSADGKWVYWPTRGGTMPQRLLRASIK